ncbi:MAG: hypothetical protein FJ104_16370 [Deltaproteobacteria bacterium]|nr:hypothetical protein [Deltaproteobacteria bacterium]
MSPTPRRRVAALLGSLLAIGCEGTVEIIASAPEGGLVEGGPPDLVDVRDVAGCRAGKYSGSFASTSPDGGGDNSLFWGNISFALRQFESGEFLVLEPDSRLEGVSDLGDATFSATILGAGPACLAGRFTSGLSRGAYNLGSVTVPFQGDVQGEYDGSGPGGGGQFAGTWSVWVGDEVDRAAPPDFVGNWLALWVDTQ